MSNASVAVTPSPKAAVGPGVAAVQRRFETLLPELASRAAAIAKSVACNAVDQEEAVAEVVAHAWLNFSSAAKRGKWLAAGQLAWVAWQAVRTGRPAAGGSSITDVLDPRLQRLRRARVISMTPWLRSRPKLGAAGTMRERAEETLVARAIAASVRTDPGVRARLRIDWAAFTRRQPLRFQRMLLDLCVGRGNAEIARRLGVTAGRATQLRADLGREVAVFFGLDAFGRELT